MKNTDYYQFNEGIILFACGCCLRGWLIPAFILSLSAAMMALLVHSFHKEDASACFLLFIPLLFFEIGTGMMQKLPLLILCTAVNILVNVLNRRETQPVYVLLAVWCSFIFFTLLSFSHPSDGLNTFFILFSIYLPMLFCLRTKRHGKQTQTILKSRA